jgi:hypothetical protein
MQNQQALHCNAEAAGATLKRKSSRRYIVMQKQYSLKRNTEVAGATL